MTLLAKYGASGWSPRGRSTNSNENKHTTFKYFVKSRVVIAYTRYMLLATLFYCYFKNQNNEPKGNDN